MNRLLLIILILTGFFFYAAPAKAEIIDSDFPFDYEHYPHIEYSFSHLILELDVDTDNVALEGSATWTVSAFSENASELKLRAGGLDISEVRINGSETEFSQENGWLKIKVSDNLKRRGNKFDVEVLYSANSRTGLLKTPSGTVFTSAAPNSKAFWLPIFEHPSVEVTTRATFTVPSGFRVVSNGFIDSSRDLEGGRRQLIWKSDEPVPVSQIGFAAGDFSFEESVIGIKGVRVYSEPGTIDQETRNDLLRYAISHLGQTQRELRREYPYDALNLIVLQDHMWEPKSFQAGYGFLYQNGGDLKAQIRRNTDAQWFGVFQRGTAWDQSVAQVFIQAVMEMGRDYDFSEISEPEYPQSSFSGWDVFSPDVWRYWKHFVTEMPIHVDRAVRESLQDLIRRDSGTFEWRDYARVWYQATGYPMMDVPMAQRTVETGLDSVVMADINFEYNSNERRLKIFFEPRELIPVDTLDLPIQVFKRSGKETRTLQVLATGGEYALSLDSAPENVTVDRSAFEHIEFFEMKDFSMWLHQLRSDDRAEYRIIAAENMPRFREDPDIQLALTDFLRREDDPRVRAAMIRALSDIVEGAGGTEQVFIAMAREATGDELQAAMDALWYYEGNQEAIAAVGRVAMNSDEPGPATAAIATYREIAEPAQFNELARSILVGQRPGIIKAALLNELFRAGDMNVAVSTSLDILEGDFPYIMRERAFTLLRGNNQDDRLRPLMAQLALDRDPRMRYLVLKNADVMQTRAMNDMLESRYNREHDPRVRSAFDEL